MQQVERRKVETEQSQRALAELLQASQRLQRDSEQLVEENQVCACSCGCACGVFAAAVHVVLTAQGWDRARERVVMTAAQHCVEIRGWCHADMLYPAVRFDRPPADVDRTALAGNAGQHGAINHDCVWSVENVQH